MDLVKKIGTVAVAVVLSFIALRGSAINETSPSGVVLAKKLDDIQAQLVRISNSLEIIAGTGTRKWIAPK